MIILSFIDAWKKSKIKREVNIWYSDYRYSMFNVNRDTTEGTIECNGDWIEYKSPKIHLKINRNSIKDVTHTSMGGDFSNSWTLVEYNENNKNKLAYFSKSSGGVMSQLFGGGKELFDMIKQWHLHEI